LQTGHVSGKIIFKQLLTIMVKVVKFFAYMAGLHNNIYINAHPISIPLFGKVEDPHGRG
jgi:hypothetical protein